MLYFVKGMYVLLLLLEKLIDIKSFKFFVHKSLESYSSSACAYFHVNFVHVLENVKYLGRLNVGFLCFLVVCNLLLEFQRFWLMICFLAKFVSYL